MDTPKPPKRDIASVSTEEFDAAFRNAQPIAPLRVVGEGEKKELPPFPGTLYSDMQEEEWEWLWTGRFPLGEPSNLEGAAGDGKSLVTASLAAGVTLGQMPGDDPRAPAGVIWFTTEESPRKTILKRLKALGADLKRVVNIDLEKFEAENPGLPKFKLPSGAKRLSKSIEHYSKLMNVPVRLVVIDGVHSTLDKGKDPNKSDDVREYLGSQRSVCMKHNLAIINIRHPSKARGVSAQHQGAGSSAWNDFPRMSWLLGREPGTEHRDFRRVLVALKTNAGRAYPGLRFHTDWLSEYGEAIVRWDDITEITADEVYTARSARAIPKATEDQVGAAMKELQRHDHATRNTARQAKIVMENSGFSGEAVYQAFLRLKEGGSGNSAADRRAGMVGGE